MTRLTDRPLRVLVVGAGGAGRRHIDNLLRLGARVSLFRYRRGRREDLEPFAGRIRIHDDLEEGLAADPDAVVVANRTDLHLPVALAAARRGCDLYIEKPVSSSLDGMGELVQETESRGLVVEVGCMWRFHPAMQRIWSILQSGEIGEPCFARLALGQHLADWRPGAEYRDSYSARAEFGGGVVLDLIHDIDLALWWFGPVQTVSAMLARQGGLDVEAETTAQIGMRHHSGVLTQICLDSLRPALQHSVEVVGADGAVGWDLSVGQLVVSKRDGQDAAEDLSSFARNDMFEGHMRHFVDRVRARRGVGTDLGAAVSPADAALPPADESLRPANESLPIDDVPLPLAEVVVPLADAVGALEVALAARNAAEQGCVVRLEEGP